MTPDVETRTVLVCGGAGFLGSHLVEGFVRAGMAVTVVDPCHPRTGGSPPNLEKVAGVITWRREGIEHLADLPEFLGGFDLVVDAMGFTHHHAGLQEPSLDHQLNYAIHLPLIEALNRTPRRLVYLASRGQYGRVSGEADESCPQVPLDVQGVHKMAVEGLIRIFSGRHGWPAVSLRLGNCFGPRQPTGDDPGLIGGFVMNILRDEAIEVYGSPSRVLQAVFVGDLVRTVVTLARQSWTGYEALNFVGPRIGMGDFLDTLIRAAGRGRYTFRPFPPEIAARHGGDSLFSEARLHARAPVTYTPLEQAFRQTLDEVQTRLSR